MKKLSSGETVRLFVPLSKDMRDAFKALCAKEKTKMADAVRDMIATTISERGPKK